jgi:hypothetical protein
MSECVKQVVAHRVCYAFELVLWCYEGLLALHRKTPCGKRSVQQSVREWILHLHM